MRPSVILLVLVILSAPARAQRPDSTARDSLAREDSARLAREPRRIRGEATSRAPEAMGAAADSVVGARHWFVTIGALTASPLVRDESVAGEPTVTATVPVGAVASVGVAWNLAHRLAGALSFRQARSEIRVDDAGSRGVGDFVTQGVTLALERSVSRRLTIRGGLGALHLNGPRDVAPFREDRAWLRPSGEAGVLLFLGGHWPLAVGLTAEAFRIGGATVGDPVRSPGTVGRLMLEGRHDW